MGRADTQEDFGILQLECFHCVLHQIRINLFLQVVNLLETFVSFVETRSVIQSAFNEMSLHFLVLKDCSWMPLVRSSLCLQFRYGMGCWVCFYWWWVLLLGFAVFLV